MKYAIFFACIAFMPCLVKADIEFISQLNFGTIAILDNTSVETYRLYEDGRVRTSDNILIVKAGAPAVIRAFNLAPNMAIVVTNLITDNEFRSGEANTDTIDFTDLSSSILLSTDESGEVVFNVGGTLATKGDDSAVYGSSFLLASFSVTIDF
jgi:hypothetical protein